jgi:hypothetical protein
MKLFACEVADAEAPRVLPAKFILHVTLEKLEVPTWTFTENEPPSPDVAFVGCVVNIGATPPVLLLNDRVATELVTEPALLVTTTVKSPAEAVCTLLSTRLAFVAPLMEAPSLRH